MRSWVTRATPAMPTTMPPPTAAMSRAIPSGMVPVTPRKWTSTFVEFCNMKTMSRISSRSAVPVATQTALARVKRAPGAGGEPSPNDGVSVGPSSDGVEGGGPDGMINLSRISETASQRSYRGLPQQSRQDPRHICLSGAVSIDPAINDDTDESGPYDPDLATPAHLDDCRISPDPANPYTKSRRTDAGFAPLVTSCAYARPPGLHVWCTRLLTSSWMSWLFVGSGRRSRVSSVRPSGMVS